MCSVYVINDLRLTTTTRNGHFIACNNINYQISIDFSRFPLRLGHGA
jgi:hypothetical protein